MISGIGFFLATIVFYPKLSYLCRRYIDVKPFRRKFCALERKVKADKLCINSYDNKILKGDLIMRNLWKLFLTIAIMATLVSCNRNTKSGAAVYELEVYKTQEVLIEEEDRNLGDITTPEALIDIDGKDVLVFVSRDSTLSYYDLATGKKMSGVDNVKQKEFVLLDTVIPVEVPLVAGDSKELSVSLEYDETSNVYWDYKFYDSDYYGARVHELIVVDKDLNYLGSIYDNKVWPRYYNGRILVDISRIKDNSVVTVNFLKLTKTDRDYK